MQTFWFSWRVGVISNLKHAAHHGPAHWYSHKMSAFN